MKKSKKPKESPAQRIGYARVSTDDQDLAMQRDALERAGCVSIYEDQAPGAGIRPELEHALRALRSGDTLIVWRLDRLGRSLVNLVEIIEGLRQRGVHVESLHEKIDTSSATGRLTLHIFAALAEFERNIIRERTMAGLRAARLRGRVGGSKPKLNAAAIRQVKKLLAAGELVQDVADRFGVERSTIWRATQREEARAAREKAKP